MKKYQSLAWMMAIAVTGITGLTACSSENIEEESANVVYDESGKAGVKPEFVISIPRTIVSTTRMSDDITQNAGIVKQFRGLDRISLIPFNTEPLPTSAKIADIMQLSPIDALNSPGAINYKVYSNEFVPVGTKYFLFYAKAIDNKAEEAISTMNDKFHYGVLNATGLKNNDFSNPRNITFSLEQINSNVKRHSDDATGKRLMTLLNDLANTTVTAAEAPNDKWSTTDNVTLAYLYKKFITLGVVSSNGIASVLSKFYFALTSIQPNDPARPLANALKNKIDAVCTSTPVSGSPLNLKSEYAGYPTNIGLPDGAVRVRWNASGLQANSFVDTNANYGKGNVVSIIQYVYPAALWYYVSTPLKASNEIESNKYDNAGSWDGVINDVYSKAGSEVQTSTQSVALSNPVQYGVGRLETRIRMEDGPFYDGDGKEVNIGTGYTLKGMLIGGQNSVGFDFKTKGDENMTIYDREMANSNITAQKNYTTAANQTLALETKSNQKVYAALELINGGEEFKGADGIIPAGGTFYLTVELDPTTAINYKEGKMDQIFKQDHVTKLTVTIKNGSTFADRDNDGNPDVYVKDENGVPVGVDTNNDGVVDPYDIDGDGNDDTFITDPTHGGPGWDTNNDGDVDIPLIPNADGSYPDSPTITDGIGNATNGIPDLTSPGIELGTSVNLEWQEGLILNPSI